MEWRCDKHSIYQSSCEDCKKIARDYQRNRRMQFRQAGLTAHGKPRQKKIRKQPGMLIPAGWLPIIDGPKVSIRRLTKEDDG